MSPKQHKIYGVLTLVIAIGLMYCLAYFGGIQTKPIFTSRPQEPLEEEIPPPPPAPTASQLAQRNYKIIMSWNVENLFDVEKSKNTHDDEFTPNQGWNEKIFRAKLANLSDIIRRVDQGFGPDILGLCEIENHFVLEQLTHHFYMEPLGYKYIYHRESRDPRGIDVALISRIPAEEVSWHYAGNANREILQAKFNLAGDELYVLVNHWRSRLGGKKPTQSYRIEAAQYCFKLVEKITKNNPQAKIIILGDFNDNPQDTSIQHHLGATIYHGNITKSLLYNLTYSTQTPTWVNTPDYHFDQIIISRGLLNSPGLRYIEGSFQTLSYRFMCNKEGRPLSFSRTKYIGYSDHFPVLASFSFAHKK